MTLIVHFMQYGQTACQMAGVPKDWAAGHRWSSAWKDVTCQDCLRGKDFIDTFTISEKRDSITCKRCNRTSYNSNDVQYHYCAYCDVFHDDIWPPARRWWIENPERDLALVSCACGYRIGFRWKQLISLEPNLEVAGVFRCPQCKANLFDQISKLSKHYHEAHQAHQP